MIKEELRMMMKLFICLCICLVILVISIMSLVKAVQLSKSKKIANETLGTIVGVISVMFICLCSIGTVVFTIELFIIYLSSV